MSEPGDFVDPSQTTTLDNCAREPIHIPGSIQPHGALLAFDRLGQLRFASANASELLGMTLQFGRALRTSDLGAQVSVHALLHRTMAQAALMPDADLPPVSQEAEIGGLMFDVVVHAHKGLTIAEFERRAVDNDQLSRFALIAYGAMDNLRRQRSVDDLLAVAAQAVRSLTGFDRVMAYRFRHDDSGDVVAEDRREDLEAFVGRRYPASDIPAQARRLYTLNTLRLIADVADEVVPLLAEPTNTEPLDLSHSVLRSVSPIHIEYLRNMGVRASMSVSIVVKGKLWGMLACHHMTPHRVPFSLRMTADVIAQLIAAQVQSLTSQEREAASAMAAHLSTQLATDITQGVEVKAALLDHAPALREILRADALVIALNGSAEILGEADALWVDKLLDWLGQQAPRLVHETEGGRLPPQLGKPVCEHCGVLALRFDGPRQGWLIALRREQVQTIRWGGKPEKQYTAGPLGPRLTPRGSFDEWRETVRGTSVPWDDSERALAAQLLDAVSRAHAARVLEADQLRSQLWAVLGHDLRNPLQSLTMASRVLEQGDKTGRMQTVIRNSADRMKRLLQDVLDVAKLQNGLVLTMDRAPHDLAAIVRLVLEEAAVAHPETEIKTELPDTLQVVVDPNRIGQLLGNLISNARHHGKGRIGLSLRAEGREAVLEVRNAGGPIPPDIAAALFDPFKRKAAENIHNRTGMGLGLFIVDQIVRGHGGQVTQRQDGGDVVFDVRLPLPQPASSP
ncbi:MAG: ATP-binding protein [Rhizobacter sp.]